MISRILALSAVALPMVTSSVNAAGCFDRTLAIARYHYTNPGSVSINWQDIYEIVLSGGTVSTTTRLTRGAVSLPNYDSSSPVYSHDGLRIAFIESDAGGTNARLKVMDATDSDNDLEGDNSSVLDAVSVDITAVAWGASDRLVYGKTDVNDDTQIASATLSGVTLGNITIHTTDVDYPDSFSFVASDEVIYEANGSSLKHISLGTNSITTLSGPSPRDRQPTGKMVGGDVFYVRIVGSTLDLWRATLSSGPTLTSVTAFLTTPAYNESTVVLSEDGACLAYLAGDLTISYGPNSDLWVRDLTTGQTEQITVTRDLASMSWKP